jgi:hypothetical protein
LHRAKRLGGRRPRETEGKDAHEGRHPEDPAGPEDLAGGGAGLLREAGQRAVEAYVGTRSEHSAFLLLTPVVGPEGEMGYRPAF